MYNFCLQRLFNFIFLYHGKKIYIHLCLHNAKPQLIFIGKRTRKTHKIVLIFKIAFTLKDNRLSTGFAKVYTDKNAKNNAITFF